MPFKQPYVNRVIRNECCTVKYVTATEVLIIIQPRKMISLRLGLNLAMICPMITDDMPNEIELDENIQITFV